MFFQSEINAKKSWNKISKFKDIKYFRASVDQEKLRWQFSLETKIGNELDFENIIDV